MLPGKRVLAGGGSSRGAGGTPSLHRLMRRRGAQAHTDSLPERWSTARTTERCVETRWPEASLASDAPRVPLAGSIPIARAALLDAMRRRVRAERRSALVRLGVRERDRADKLTCGRPRPDIDPVDTAFLVGWAGGPRVSTIHVSSPGSAIFRCPSSSSRTSAVFAPAKSSCEKGYRTFKPRRQRVTDEGAAGGHSPTRGRFLCGTTAPAEGAAGGRAPTRGRLLCGSPAPGGNSTELGCA